MQDPIWKRFGYGQLWPLRPACSQNRAASCMPDPTSAWDSVRPKKAWIMLCKTGPNPIWMAWWGFGQTHLVQKQVTVQESSGSVVAERYRPDTSFPLSHPVAFFHRRPGSYCAKPARIRFSSGWLCQVFAERIRSGSNTRCASIIWLASGQPFRADPDRMRIRSGMFTGDANNNCTKDNNNRKAKVLGNRCAPFAKLSNCTITLLTDKNRSFANISKTPGNDYLQKGI